MDNLQVGQREHRTHRIYNYKFQRPDNRDKLFPQIVEVKRLKVMALPKSVTLRKWCSEIEDQEELGGLMLLLENMLLELIIL